VSAVLLSIKPRFAVRILSGDKTAEVRRRFPALEPDTVMYLYASTPVRAVVGTLRLEAVHADTPHSLWRRFGPRLDISEEYFTEYLDGRNEAAVVELGVREKWSRPVTLDKLRTVVRVEPPQSFRYLDSAQEGELRKAAREGADS